MCFAGLIPYEFDSHGNWITQTSITKDDAGEEKNILITIRQIEYYDE